MQSWMEALLKFGNLRDAVAKAWCCWSGSESKLSVKSSISWLWFGQNVWKCAGFERACWSSSSSG